MKVSRAKIRVTLTAIITTRAGRRRRKAVTSLCPVSAARQVSTSTANVVTRMPPAVEELPPPMNISMLMNTRVGSLSSGTQDRSNPADRGITAADSAAWSLTPRSASAYSRGLFHSTATYHSREHRTSANVVTSVSLVCSCQRRGGMRWRQARARLSSTGKPSVPQNALSRIGRPTAGLLTCRPAASGVNPVLL